jgi:hypothetical protein
MATSLHKSFTHKFLPKIFSKSVTFGKVKAFRRAVTLFTTPSADAELLSLDYVTTLSAAGVT